MERGIKEGDKPEDVKALRRELAALRTKLAAMERSTSWRATAPLRWVINSARGASRLLPKPPAAPVRHKPGIVAIDITNIWHADGGTGIQRVVRATAVALASSGANGRRVVLVDAAGRELLDVTNDFMRGEKSRGHHAGVDEIEALVMLDYSHSLSPRFASRLRQCRKAGVRVVTTCHDLLPVRYPKMFQAHNRMAYLRWLDAASKHSDAMMCISEATAGALRSYLKKRTTRAPAVGSWPLGQDFAFVGRAPLPPEARSPFVLMVGTVEPRKRHDFVVSALREMRRRGQEAPFLVVVGRYGWGSRETAALLHEEEKAGRAKWFAGGLGDEELASLYGSASALIQASLDEGFGLPVAEAAHYEKPVVLSDIPVFREVVKAHGYFFQTDDEKGFGEALARAMAPGAPPTETVAVSWKESAEKFWSTCESLLATAADPRSRR